ncbi:hypothetical protein GQ42DRAFT_117118 [Ramicandelaber brevisporus]|nr:hypothetical protein GQ42DRAFT_117118 [Ramicandelaber brevisporus]
MHHLNACASLGGSGDNANANGDGGPKALEEHMQSIVSFLRASGSRSCWLVPALCHMSRQLYKLALNTPAPAGGNSVPEVDGPLAEAARAINRAFTTCINDRRPFNVSWKWGTYHHAILMFRIYARLHTPHLCTNFIRAIATLPLPEFQLFPKSCRITYNYFLGSYEFVREEYTQAEQHLTAALNECVAPAGCNEQARAVFEHNREMILMLLIPLQLIRGALPSPVLFSRHPRLALLYGPFERAVHTGNVALFDKALAHAEPTLLSRGTFFAIEQARLVVLRTLAKRTYTISYKLAVERGQAERAHMVPFSAFQSALRLLDNDMDSSIENIECILVNLIARGYMRGYLSHEKQIAVLSKVQAFPPLEDVPHVTY